MMIKELILLYLSTASVLGIEYFNGNGPPSIEDIPVADKQFRVVYEWRTIDFAYDNEYERGRARQNGEFIERNILISDVEAFANRLYVTLPRMLPGVPATLGWIISPDNNGRSDPMVEPFPSWDMNKEGNCWALQFVQGIAISADGVLWAVDSGRIHTLRPDRAVATCPPKIVLIDLKGNGTVLHRYEFPEDVVSRGKNYLNKIVVDDAMGGYAYITDNSGSDPGIVVFSRRFNRSWKVREPNSMRAAANAVDFAVNGTNLKFSIHIDGIALGPYYNPNTGDALEINSPKLTADSFERNVYYSPLSSYHLYSLPASLLRNPDVVLRTSPRQLTEAVTDYGLKLSQSDGMIMDNRGILYFGLLKEHAIAQWDSFQPFTAVNQHVIAKDDDFIQWTDGMSFDERGNLFVVVNRLHNFVAGRLNPNEINFRILRARTGGLNYVFTNSPGYTPINLIPEQAININSPNLNFGAVSSTPFYNQLESRNPYYGYSSSARPFISTIVVVCLALRYYL